ncbi:MAG: aspartyl protease family protein [Cyanobacteria bacterium J06621_3]
MQVGNLTIPIFEKNQMGQVTATITVTNHIDQILAARGFIPEGEVRSITLQNVLVDTGATLLSFPTSLIEQLGLPVKGDTEVKTANGPVPSRIFCDASLEINGRHSTFDCLELTTLDIPLLGVLPMETLGLEPDLQKNELRMLPMTGDDSYIYVV